MVPQKFGDFKKHTSDVTIEALNMEKKGVTPPKTNLEPENEALEEEISI